MKNLILKTSLIIITSAVSVTAYSQSIANELNLSESQVEQLQEFKANKKAQREARKEAQLAEDKAILSTFLTPEQVEAVINRAKQQGEKDKKPQRNNKKNVILELASQLNLTENQIIQIQGIIDSNKPVEGAQKPSKEESKAKRASIKTQILAVLDQSQIDKLKELRKEKKKNKPSQAQ